MQFEIGGIEEWNDPGPFDVAKLMPVAYVVALLFIGLSLLTFAADVLNPVNPFR